MKLEIDCTETEGDEIIRELPSTGIASGQLEVLVANEAGGGFDMSVVIHLDVTLDLTKVAIIAFASWLVRKARAVKGCRHIKVDGHYFPVDDADAPKLIADKIEQEQKKQKPNQ